MTFGMNLAFCCWWLLTYPSRPIICLVCRFLPTRAETKCRGVCPGFAQGDFLFLVLALQKDL